MAVSASLCLAVILAPHVNAALLGGQRTTSSTHFDGFIENFGRDYKPGTTEYLERGRFYQENLAKVLKQNSDPKRLWTAALNDFSDRSPSEMDSLNGWRGRGYRSESEAAPTSMLQEKAADVHRHQDPDEAPAFLNELPKDVNWTHLWAAQPSQVRFQGCGNCWAAASTSLIECHYEIYRGEKQRLNYWEVTDCTANPYACGGAGGCQGATSELAIHQFMMNGHDGFSNKAGDKKSPSCPASKIPLDTQVAPPHEWGEGTRNAPADALGRQFGLIGWQRLPVNQYEPVMRALFERGPVSVAISTDWGNYGSGIYDGCKVDARVGHAVLLIGYGQGKKGTNEEGKNYWMIQNSWGKGFGENGHIRILRQNNEEKVCGTDSQPQQGVTCNDGPKTERVCGMCAMLYDVVVPIFEGTTTTSQMLAERRHEVASIAQEPAVSMLQTKSPPRRLSLHKK